MGRIERGSFPGHTRMTGSGSLRAIALAGVFAVLVLAGPFSAPGAAERGTGSPEPPGAYEFALEDINPSSPHHGRTLRLSELYPGGGVVLNFMASWCQPCQLELPVLERIHAAGEAKVVCIAADEYGGTAGVLPMIEKLGITMPVLYAPEDLAFSIAEHYTYRILPATYMIDRAGRVRSVHEGLMTPDDLIEAIRRDLD